MELHGSAKKSLKQSVVQVLCDSRPLRKAFFEANTELPGELVQSETTDSRECQNARKYSRAAEPPGLPEHGYDFEPYGGFGAVPNAVRISRHHPEVIPARA